MNLDLPLKGDELPPNQTMRQRLTFLSTAIEQAEDLLLAVDATLVPIADLRAGKVEPTREYAQAIMKGVEAAWRLREAVEAILAASEVVVVP